MNIRQIGDGRKQTWPDDEVGSKAANLARVAALGLPVPPAFVLPIEDCVGAAEANAAAEQQLAGALNEGIAYLETATGRKFGDRRRPLLVSVRSGAAVSMPGMLNTVLNVDSPPGATRALIRMTDKPAFPWDALR